MAAVTSANATSARNRREYHTTRIEAQTTTAKRRWQALAWLSAEADEFPSDEAGVPLALLLDLAAEMNAMNAERRKR